MPESPVVAAARRYAAQHDPKRIDWYAETAKEVERKYTEAICRFHHANRIYDIPVNFFSAYGRALFEKFAVPGSDRYEIHGAGSLPGWSGLHFFWPDFKGFKLDNWFDSFDRRIIKCTTFQVRPLDTTQRSTEEVFELRMSMNRIEQRPSVELCGLKGYRFSNRRDYVWVGARADGQMFMMDAFDPRDKNAFAMLPNPLCDVRMYDRNKGEDVVYFYSLDLFEHWREIDTRIQATIQSWRVS